MELYVKVSFWLTVIGIALRVITMSMQTFPVKKEETIGQVVGGLIMSMSFAIWAAIVLWIR